MSRVKADKNKKTTYVVFFCTANCKVINEDSSIVSTETERRIFMFGKTKPKTEQKEQSVKNEKKTDKKKKMTGTGKASQKIRKTVQQSIPYVAAYPNGVIEVRSNVYSKMYQFSDINFTDATDEDQWSMKEQWGKLLCLFTPDMNVELYSTESWMKEKYITKYS